MSTEYGGVDPEESKERRARNRQNSAALLTGEGFAFESKNRDAHLIVEGLVDFWPGTGLWIVRGETAQHRGVRSLIKWLKRREKK